MIRKQFGNSGKMVPVIGQGSWAIPESGNAKKEAIDSLQLGIDIGMTHIDTAEMYGNGGAEEVIGEAIKGIKRNKLFIVSKVLPSNASYKGTIKACENSLRRLKTDYLDCYLLHWPGSFPLEETMTALEQLVKEGKILSLGLSNFDVDGLKEAKSFLQKEKIACNQVFYHLGERGIERKLIPYCQRQDIAIVAYTPFGQNGLPSENSTKGKALRQVADKHGVSVRQVILAFLTRKDIVFTIPKASKADHVKDNAAAGDLVLDSSDIRLIDSHFPAPAKDRPLATL